jgi:rhodanese-related sulfurtransferase
MDVKKVDSDLLKVCAEDVKDKKAILLDVRTKEEWAAGCAEGATHFELTRLESGETPDIPKDAKICVYCAAGGRAEKAKGILAAKGFTNVQNIGGLRDWKMAGGAVEIPCEK